MAKREWWPVLWIGLVVLAFANFAWYIGEVVDAGGIPYAVTSGGQFVLNNHGAFTVVSRETWDWLTFHGGTVTASVLGGLTLVIVSVATPFDRVRRVTNGHRAAVASLALLVGILAISGQILDAVSGVLLLSLLVIVVARLGSRRVKV